MRSSVGYPREKSSMTFDWRIAFATSNEVSGNDVKKDIDYKKRHTPMRSSVGYPRGKRTMTFDWRIAFATSDKVSGNDVKS